MNQSVRASDDVGSKNGYRADIDGLRAISILAVLAFHGGLPWVPGGFAGVDIFFVISGYLITGHLITEHKRNGKIQLTEFWARRVRRLAPALLFVIGASVLAAPWVLERVSGEVGELVRAVVATVFLNANHYFMYQAGNYFADAAETNPMLHMWSLAVEEQFYLVWPLLLVFLLRVGSVRTLAMGLVVLASISFALSCWLTSSNATSAFYLMPSRAWELLAGAALAMWCTPQRLRMQGAMAAWVGASGVALLAISLLLLSGQTLFPGPAAILPVAGAALMITAGTALPENPVSRLVGSNWLAYLGRISYPLYLWHWPILTISRSTRLYEPSPFADVLALLASLVLAALTYRFIEQPVWRLWKVLPARSVLIRGALLCTLTLGIALMTGAWARYGWQYSDEERALDLARKDRPALDCIFSTAFPPETTLANCYRKTNKPTILLLGDSHANHWRPGLEVAANSSGVGLGVLTMKACRPLPGPVGPEACVGFNAEVAARLQEWIHSNDLRGVILSAKWAVGTGTTVPTLAAGTVRRNESLYDARAHTQEELLRVFESDLRQVLTSTQAIGLRVLLILPSPVQTFAPVQCLAHREPERCMVTRTRFDEYAGPSEAVLRRVAQDYPHVHLLDPKDFLCRNQRCPSVIDGMIVYSDANHLTRTFSAASSNHFTDEIKWLTQIR